jgi:hypothetical protein
MEDQLETTLTRALTEAEIQSLAAAAEAHERGYIDQTEVKPGSGVWTLKQTKVE